MESIILDDNQEYIIIEELKYNNTKYILFNNIDDVTNFCIRKIVNENGIDYYVRLDNETEVNLILNMFKKEVLKDFNKE